MLTKKTWNFQKAEFKDANVCLFVFDIIYYNGEPLMNRYVDRNMI